MNDTTYKTPIKGLYLTIRGGSTNNIYQYRFKPKGQKVVRVSTGTSDFADAMTIAIHAYREYQLNPNAFRPAKILSFKALAEQWLETRTGSNDYDRSETAVNKFLIPYFQDDKKVKDVRDLTKQLLEDYVDWRRYYWVNQPPEPVDALPIRRNGRTIRKTSKPTTVVTDATLKRENITLRHILKYGVDKGFISKDVDLTLPKLSVVIVTRPEFSVDQADRIWKLAKSRYAIANAMRSRERRMLYGFITVLRFTGMRPGEAIALNWRDVDLSNPVKPFLRVRGIVPRGRKTGARSVPILFGDAVSVLQDMWNLRVDELGGVAPSDCEPLFIHPDGTRIAEFASSFDNLLAACNFDKPAGRYGFSQYSFRHSIITDWSQQGMPLKIIADCLGTSVEMIERYYDHNGVHQAFDWVLANAKAPPPKQPDIGNITVGSSGLVISSDDKSGKSLVIKDGGLTFK